MEEANRFARILSRRKADNAAAREKGRKDTGTFIEY